MQKNCKSCKFSYMEPCDMNLICGHSDSGQMGLYVLRGPAKHCGPERIKWEQHPMRTENGDLHA